MGYGVLGGVDSPTSSTIPEYFIIWLLTGGCKINQCVQCATGAHYSIHATVCRGRKNNMIPS